MEERISTKLECHHIKVLWSWHQECWELNKVLTAQVWGPEFSSCTRRKNMKVAQGEEHQRSVLSRRQETLCGQPVSWKRRASGSVKAIVSRNEVECLWDGSAEKASVTESDDFTLIPGIYIVERVWPQCTNSNFQGRRVGGWGLE